MDKILFIRQNNKDFAEAESYTPKVLTITHLIRIICLCFTFYLCGESMSAQSIKLSLNLQNITYKEAFKEIEKKTNMILYLSTIRTKN